jgi:hypothetical protein
VKERLVGVADVIIASGNATLYRPSVRSRLGPETQNSSWVSTS